MLKNLTLKNFVHFREELTFSFNKGSNFFIGENRSGKSCTFEAVRRCMSTSKNFFMSTSHNHDEPSYVICEYTRNYDIDKQPKTVHSCVVSVPGKNEISVKIVIEKNTDYKMYVDLVRKNRHGYPVNMMFPIKDVNYVESVRTLLGTEISTKSLNDFLFKNICITKTESYRSFVSETVDREYDTKTDCEMYLKQIIDQEVVITEPMRSVSVAQWSNSPKFDIPTRTPEGDDRFIFEMRFNSDIITWYLDNKTISDEERKAVDNIFNVLTDNSSLRFENRNGILHVIDNGTVVTLEKAPEGLLEAKICAILLSIQQFKTICLEEPGKGMHLQMIERLRDLVLKRGSNKTIIMITQIPAFINTWNIENICFFRRSSDLEGKPLFTAIHGHKLKQRDEQKSRRIWVDYSLSTMFFASRVLLVEGRSDERFMLAVKSILLHDRDLAMSILAQTNPTVTIDALYHFLSSLHVLPLHGQRNKVRFENVCAALALERYFILDYDAILDTNESTEKFFVGFGLKDLEDEFGRKGVTVLEDKGIFLWDKPSPDKKKPNQKSGTIEDALIQLINQDKKGLKDLFTENHTILNWDYKDNNDKKLFRERDVTDFNVAGVVSGVIRSCLKHTKSDVFRLMQFLVRGPVTKSAEATSSVIQERS